MTCSVNPADGDFASSMIRFVDCQAQTIGAQGYLALAAPNAIIAQLLTVLLTIFVALIGYRMIFGETPTVREGVFSLVKVGLVVAFATGWPAYRTVVYDVAMTAPGQFAATIGGAAGLPGVAGDLAAHLDAVDQQFQQLAIDNATLGVVAPQPSTTAPPLFTGFDTFALGAARVMFLVGVLGAYAATRLIVGLMLALGPLFIAFLLFEGTRGLFEGWLRILAGAALASLVASLILGIELALFEPWLASLIARRAAEGSISAAAAQLLAVTLVFGVVVLAGIAAAARTAWSLRLAGAWRHTSVMMPGHHADMTAMHEAGVRPEPRGVAGERSRAVMVAEAARTLDRRDAGIAAYGAGAANSFASSSSIPARAGAPEPETMRTPAAADRRRTGLRVSGSAQRRDALR